MAEESVSPSEETVSREEFLNLQEQLKSARAERDRQAFEKAEIVSRANGFARERDDLRDRLAATTAERDRLAAEKAAETDRAESAERRAGETGRRLAEIEAEAARLRQALAEAPSNDPAQVLVALLGDKGRSAVAWVRGQIPAESPLLSYFDKSVETTLLIGGQAARLSGEAWLWAKPRMIEFLQSLGSPAGEGKDKK
jgi:hypothetical protein